MPGTGTCCAFSDAAPLERREIDVAQPKEKVRYAVVGLGYIAQVAVLPAFAHARRNSTLTALVSSDREKLTQLGDAYEVPLRCHYDDLEHCLQEVDAVYIATPNSEHAEFAVRAAHAGVHVLCEKPLAASEVDCQRMIRACDEAGVKLMTAYRLHFEPLTLELLELVRKGRIGDVRYFTSAFSMQAKPDGIRTRPETGGGTLWDLGIYCINAARVLFGSEPTHVFGYSIDGARSGMPGVDDITSAVLQFEGDCLATFTSSFDAADASSYRIVGTEGSILMEPAYEYAEPLAYTLTVGGKTTKRRGRKRDQFAAELLYFSDCVRKNREPEPSGAEGAWDVRIIEGIYESARRGQPVTLRRFGREPGPARGQAIAVPPVREAPELVNA
jgi:predicted dehydrogenase